MQHNFSSGSLSPFSLAELSPEAAGDVLLGCSFSLDASSLSQQYSWSPAYTADPTTHNLPSFSLTLYLISSPYDSLGSNHFGCFQQLEVHFLPAIHWLFQHYIFAKMWPGWGSPWSTNCWILFTLTLFLCPFLGTSYWPRLRNTTVGYQSLYKIIPMILYGKCSMFLSFYNALFMLCYNKCKSVWVMRLYYFKEKGCFFF